MPKCRFKVGDRVKGVHKGKVRTGTVTDRWISVWEVSVDWDDGNSENPVDDWCFEQDLELEGVK